MENEIRGDIPDIACQLSGEHAVSPDRSLYGERGSLRLVVFGVVLSGSVIFKQTKLAGVMEILPEPKTDERGFFARTWCQKEFEAQRLNPSLVQCDLSVNIRKGTLRGMHYQAPPYSEAKLVQCIRGEIYDVVLDLRAGSATYKEWIGEVLTAEQHNMLYIPEGCAHGFLTLVDQTEVFYQMSEFYQPEAARGYRWNDPAFRIDWPAAIQVISERDRTYPDFELDNER